MVSFLIVVPKSLGRNNLKLEGLLLAHGNEGAVHREGEVSLCVRRMAVTTDPRGCLRSSQQSRKQRKGAGSRADCKPTPLKPLPTSEKVLQSAQPWCDQLETKH